MTSSRPNLLLIVLDTMRRDRLSAYGGPRETSPNLDRFASDAALFARATSGAQWTVPAHASMFTGLYPSAHGLTEADYRLSSALPTLAERLSHAGYETVGFCNNPLVGLLDHGLTRGFESFYNYAGAAINRPFERPLNPPLDGAVRGWREFARTVSNQFARREWLFRASLHPLITPLWTRLVNYKGSSPDSISDVIHYLEHQRAGGQTRPLFTFLNLMGTHLPYRPTSDALRHIAPNMDEASYRFVGRFNADAARWASPTESPLEDWQTAALEAFYDAEIFAQDVQLGHLLRYLKQSGALKDTVVVITADHGEGHGDHGFFGHSFIVNQELVHVPLIVSHPDGFAVGERIDAHVSTRRVFHTLLEAAGAFEPEHPSHLSLVEPAADGPIAFSEAFPPQTFLTVMRQRAPALIDRLRLTQVRRAVLSGQHKLTTVGGRVEALYDTAADPLELHDLSAQHPALTSDLLRELEQFVGAQDAARDGLAALAEQSALTPDMLDHLRALGYLD
jgi:arylsulfatase A-like enzyme